MMPPPPEKRPIFQREDMAEMSIGGQVIMATVNLGTHANKMRLEMDVESLRFHCQAALQELSMEPLATEPAAIARQKLAKYRAVRGLQLANAAVEFLKAYDKANEEKQP